MNDFIRCQALNVALLNFDSYIGFRGNPIYVFDTKVLQWQVTPWDFNAAFRLWDTINNILETYPFIPFNIVDGYIAGRINAVTEIKQYCMEAIYELHSMMDDEDSYFEEIDRLANQIRDALYDDNRKLVSNINFKQGIGYGYQELFFENQLGLKELVSTRAEVLKNGLLNQDYVCSVSVDDFIVIEKMLLPDPTTNYVFLSGEYDEANSRRYVI